MICKACGLPKFVGPVSYCGAQCSCDFKTLPQMYDAQTAEIESLQSRVRELEERCTFLTKLYDGREDALSKAYAKLAARQSAEPVEAILLSDCDEGHDPRYGRVFIATTDSVQLLYATPQSLLEVKEE
jgi:hypothetical protein